MLCSATLYVHGQVSHPSQSAASAAPRRPAPPRSPHSHERDLLLTHEEAALFTPYRLAPHRLAWAMGGYAGYGYGRPHDHVEPWKSFRSRGLASSAAPHAPAAPSPSITIMGCRETRAGPGSRCKPSEARLDIHSAPPRPALPVTRPLPAAGGASLGASHGASRNPRPYPGKNSRI